MTNPNTIKQYDAELWYVERNARFAFRPVGLASKRWTKDGYTIKPA